MGTTTKMAIPYPEATGLVKNGWEDMKDIADQVDAKSGLVLLNTTSFSAVTTQSINNVFSTNYTNYRILITTTSSLNMQLFLRLRASSTDTTTNYYWAGLYVPTSGSATVSGFNGSGSTSWFRICGASAANRRTTASVDIFNPQNALITSFNSSATDEYSYSVYQSGAINNTTQYDGFTLLMDTVGATMTGSLSVYGYNI